MNKFKSLILLLLLVPCMLVLSACGGTKEGDNGGDLGDNNNGNYAEINFDEDYIKQHMPSEYQISFSVVGYANNQVSDTYTVTYAKKDNNYYFKMKDFESLYTPVQGQTGKYVWYYSSGGEDWDMLDNFGEYFGQEYVDTISDTWYSTYFFSYGTSHTNCRQKLHKIHSPKHLSFKHNEF